MFVETFGSAAIILAVVAALNKAFALSARWSLLAGAVVSIVVTVTLTVANAGSQPIDWSQLPLQALLGWLTAMGTWTGGKVAIKGTAGGEPRP